VNGAVYGRAGGNLGSFTGHAGVNGQAHGYKAELDTAELLDAYARRGLTVFHSVRVRGGAADIDHVLVGSKGVVLIDTKAWKPGTYMALGAKVYRFTASRVLPERFAPGESMSLARSAAQMRAAGVPVVAAIVAVWSSGAGRVRLALMRYPGAKRITTARKAVKIARRLAGRRAALPETVEDVARWVRMNEERR
jgi:NERD domain protein